MVATPNYGLSTDTTLGGNSPSDIISPSEKAIKTYVDTAASEHVTLGTDQQITGEKTFVGEKRIKFKQAQSGNKLGFTLFDYNNVEKGYLEFNPSNEIDNAPLMTLGNYATTNNMVTQVGFRRYSSVSNADGAYNLLTPLIADARTPFNLTTTYTNFYLPLGFTDGTTTVTASKSGMVDLSSLLPEGGSLPEQTGQAGKFLTTNGTEASWANTTKVTVRDWSVS